MSKNIIVLVEDNTYFSDLLKMIFEQEGAKVLQAKTEEEGREAFNSAGKDLLCIILGGKLGGSSTTLPLAIKIGQLKIPDLPIVAFSVDYDFQKELMGPGRCTIGFEKTEADKLIPFVKKLIQEHK
jgi:DNA-binding NtrC family response regulator